MAEAVKNSRNLDEVKEWLFDVMKEDGGEKVIEYAIQLLGQMQNEVNALTLEKMRLLKAKVGRTSEKISREQLDLLLSSVNDDDEDNEEEYDPEAAKEARRKAKQQLRNEKAKKRKNHNKKRGRKSLPEHLPREVSEVAVPDDKRVCETCNEQKSTIGYATSEVLEFRPASFVVLQEKREKVACLAARTTSLRRRLVRDSSTKDCSALDFSPIY